VIDEYDAHALQIMSGLREEGVIVGVEERCSLMQKRGHSSEQRCPTELAEIA
jgi:hypothetical protein